MKRRILAGLLVCLLMISLAAGCGAPPASLPETAAETRTTAETIKKQDEPTGPDTDPAESVVTTETAPDTVTAEPVVTTEVVPDTTEAAPETTAAEPDPLEELLMKMTLEEKVAQMLVVTPETLTGRDSYLTKLDDAFGAAYDRLPVGGVLLMGGNLKDPEQTTALLGALQDLSRDRTGLPLFLCVDEEGGSVARISGNPAFGVPKIPAMSTVHDAETARELGRAMGTYLRDLGFNVDFAPDADVLTNPENRVVRDRSFGSDSDAVTELAEALAEGLLEEGVLPCWKHFPGHGGTAEDSHKGFAVLHLDRSAPAESPELRPFLHAAEHGVPMIMAGHITVPELDPELPASLSPALLCLLRGAERDYEGLLITDALGMGAITERFGQGEAAVLAVLAGNDLLLAPEDPEAARQAILEAVRDGTIPEGRIDESVYRILRAKNGLP